MAGNLPVQLTGFVGREQQLAELAGLLTSARLLTLTGPGGCGKTRLALRAAESATKTWPGRVWWLELTSLGDPALLPQFLALALNVSANPDQSPLDAVVDYLGGQPGLLLLDNCEHLIDECAWLSRLLLARTAALTILATSREPLAIAGERLFPLTGLSCPPVVAGVTDTAHLLAYDAVRLYVERARAVVPEFALTPDIAPFVIHICRRLDGLPLALELAAARANILTPEETAARLDERFDLLASKQRDSDPRHQTLRRALDWSYDLLKPREQTALRRLAVFAGRFSLDEAKVVCLDEDAGEDEALEITSSLVSKSLVLAHTLQRGETRYSLLETVRQYGREKLAAAGEWDVIHDRFLATMVRLAEATAPKLIGPFQRLWLNWLAGEYDNVRAALAWSLADPGAEPGGASERVAPGLRIAIALYQLWTIRDYAEEGLTWFQRLLARADERVPASIRANALAYTIFLAGFRGNVAAQDEYGRAAALLAEQVTDDDRLALAWIRTAQAIGARASGDFESALSFGNEAIRLHRGTDSAYLLAVSLSTTSFTAMSLERFDEARAMLDEALPLLRAIGNPYRIAMVLNFSGDLARCQRQYERARSAYEESIAILRELDAPRDLASALQNLAHTRLRQGDVRRARDLLDESLTIQLTQQNAPGVAECLIGFAALAAVGGSPGVTARLLAAAVVVGGPRVATAWAATRIEYEHYSALARAALTEAEFETEQTAGRSWSMERAVAYARSLPSMASAPAARHQADALTAREREVAAHIAQGKTNGEIAAELVLSKRTVEKHVAHILAKLGLVHRAQIVRWVIDAEASSAPTPATA